MVMNVVLSAMMMAQVAPPPLEPTGKWTIAYEDEMCLLSRDYSTEGRILHYAVKPVTFGDVADVMIVIGGDNLGQDYRLGKASISVGPGTAPIEGRFRSWRTPGQARRVIAIEVPRGALPRIAAARELMLNADRKDYRLAQPGGVKALSALDTCEQDMIKAFTAGAEAENDLAADVPPLPDNSARAHDNPALWITADDYPEEAVRMRLEGTTAARWIIGTDGRIKKCLITARSDHPGLDALVCKALTERARYKPAIGVDGRPVESTSSRRIVWKLP